MLAALAIRPGEVVSAERLADALWGEHPPASWHKVVPGCILRLRRALGTDAIETTPYGYRLAVAADQVDVQRFERLLRAWPGTAQPGRTRAGRSTPWTRRSACGAGSR